MDMKMLPNQIAEKTSEELVSLEKAKKMLSEAYEKKMSQFFSVTFVKRTSPYSHRTYSGCRFGVTKYFKTEKGEPAYNFIEKELLPVWVSDKKEVLKIDDAGVETTTKVAEGYKVVNMRSLVAFKLHGKKYRVKSGG